MYGDSLLESVVRAIIRKYGPTFLMGAVVGFGVGVHSLLVERAGISAAGLTTTLESILRWDLGDKWWIIPLVGMPIMFGLICAYARFILVVLARVIGSII